VIEVVRILSRLLHGQHPDTSSSFLHGNHLPRVGGMEMDLIGTADHRAAEIHRRPRGRPRFHTVDFGIILGAEYTAPTGYPQQ